MIARVLTETTLNQALLMQLISLLSSQHARAFASVPAGLIFGASKLFLDVFYAETLSSVDRLSTRLSSWTLHN